MKKEHALIEVLGSDVSASAFLAIIDSMSNINWNETEDSLLKLTGHDTSLLMRVIEKIDMDLTQFPERVQKDWKSVWDRLYAERNTWSEETRLKCVDRYFGKHGNGLKCFSENIREEILNNIAGLIPGFKVNEIAFKSAVRMQNIPLVREMIKLGADVNQMVLCEYGGRYDLDKVNMPISAFIRTKDLLNEFFAAGLNLKAKAVVVDGNGCSKQVDVYESMVIDARAYASGKDKKTEEQLEVESMVRHGLLDGLSDDKRVAVQMGWLKALMDRFGSSWDYDKVGLERLLRELPESIKEGYDEHGLNIAQNIRLKYGRSKASSLIELIGCTKEERHYRNAYGFNSIHYGLMFGSKYFADDALEPEDYIKRNKIYREIATFEGFKKFKNEALRVHALMPEKGGLMSVFINGDGLGFSGEAQPRFQPESAFGRFIDEIREGRSFATCLSAFGAVMNRVDAETTLDEQVGYLRFAGETGEFQIAANGFGCILEKAKEVCNEKVQALRNASNEIFVLFSHDGTGENREDVELKFFRTMNFILKSHPEIWSIINNEFVLKEYKGFASLFNTNEKQSIWSKLISLGESIVLKSGYVGLNDIKIPKNIL